MKKSTQQVYKTVKQNVNIEDKTVLRLMNTFKYMVNECIRVGIENKKGDKYPNGIGIRSLHYHNLMKKYKTHSEYADTACRVAGGILQNRAHAERRGIIPKSPFLKEGRLSCSHPIYCKIKDGNIIIPIGGSSDRGKIFELELNKYTLNKLNNMKVNSFNLFPTKLTISYSNPNIKQKQFNLRRYKTVGIDRNLDCITYGNKKDGVKKIDIKKNKQVIENTRKITKSFKRDDNRIRGELNKKYGKRQKNRINSKLHEISKFIINDSKQKKYIVVSEDITHVRNKHTKNTNQNRSTRFKMNSWSFGEIKRQIDYKATWAGVPTHTLSREQTMYTSQACYKCGQITQYDQKTRINTCEKCKIVIDRDELGAINIAQRGKEEIARNGPSIFTGSKGVVDEGRSSHIPKQIQSSSLKQKIGIIEQKKVIKNSLKQKINSLKQKISRTNI